MSEETELAGAAGATGGGLLVLVIGAITAFIRTVFGSKAERVDATERAAEIALRAAEHADERAERADEQSAVHKRERLTCEEQLSAMRAENQARDEATAEAFRLMREELGKLRDENAALRREVKLQRKALDGLLMRSTPPDGLHTPDEVRAGVLAQQQEETGP